MTCPVCRRTNSGVARSSAGDADARRRPGGVDAVRAGGQDEDRDAAGVEDQAVGDRADLAAERLGGECGGVDRIGQDDHVTGASAPVSARLGNRGDRGMLARHAGSLATVRLLRGMSRCGRQVPGSITNALRAARAGRASQRRDRAADLGAARRGDPGRGPRATRPPRRSSPPAAWRRCGTRRSCRSSCRWRWSRSSSSCCSSWCSRAFLADGHGWSRLVLTRMAVFGVLVAALGLLNHGCRCCFVVLSAVFMVLYVTLRVLPLAQGHQRLPARALKFSPAPPSAS